jgi:hypothetical protein
MPNTARKLVGYTNKMRKEPPLQDALFILVSLGFFALGVLYTYACGKL